MQTGVELANVRMSMNPFCEIAVEVVVSSLLLGPQKLTSCGYSSMQTSLHDKQEALRLKEQKIAKEVVVVSVGPKSSQVSQQQDT